MTVRQMNGWEREDNNKVEERDTFCVFRQLLSCPSSS